MYNLNNNNKSACYSSSFPWNSSSKNFQKCWCNWLEKFIKKWYSSLNPSKNIYEHGKQSYSEEDSFKIIGIRPTISCHVSPIGQNIVIPNTNSFNEKILDHNRKNCRQHDSSYYQPQSAVKNHCKQCCNDRIIQQDSYKNDYDRDKRV